MIKYDVIASRKGNQVVINHSKITGIGGVYEGEESLRKALKESNPYARLLLLEPLNG